MSDYIDRTARFEFKTDPDNGMLIGPSGCHYDNESEAMYFDQIGLCGCGCPSGVHQFLLDCMAAIRDDDSGLLDPKRIAAIIEQELESATEFVLHFLDSRELTEHGGSVYGSWLTERGRQALEIGAINHEL